ncbi:unnamed protein product [Urochloa decumbens]|uniref:Clathrin/coatomer adaptor adaptin-like N-terminal domain-containing protein n=1 Tax=Urochloa decumbens TaxID=240449 RepID=A0ABC9G1A2_9POAL
MEAVSMIGDDAKSCTLVVRFEKRYPVVVAGLKSDLKYGDATTKARALKHAISLVVNGDTPDFRDLPAIVVRFVLPCEDLTVQKLVLLYLETVYKGVDVFGRVPPDAALVRDYLRKNLKHGDEYIRGITLSFLSRLKGNRDLLDRLVVESVLVNLYHRHGFVRRHAYSAAFAIYLWLPSGRQLLPDLLERVEHELPYERDAAATRNALFMLCFYARERAVAYLLANSDGVVDKWPGTVQMFAIAMMRHACNYWCLSKKKRNRFIKIIMSILSTCSNSNAAVIYEGAGALLSLCSKPVEVRAAADAYYRLLCSSRDKDVESTVLDRLDELRISHSDVMV